MAVSHTFRPIGVKTRPSSSSSRKKRFHLHARVRQQLAVVLAQVLSRALGGVTGPSSIGWEFGLKEFAVSPALASKPYATQLPPKIKILGVHRDQVENPLKSVRTYFLAKQSKLAHVEFRLVLVSLEFLAHR